jgi:hypothetical protein
MDAFQVYLDTTDISDDVLNIRGLEVCKHERDRSVSLPRPTLEISDTVTIEKDDIIKFRIDGAWKLVTYVDNIKPNKSKRSNTIYLFDVIKKLENYYIADLAASMWAGYATSTIEYKMLGNGSGYYDEHYISVCFLLRVMMYNCTDIIMPNVTTNYINLISSPFQHELSGGSTSYVLYQYLLFQWEQLKTVKKSDSTDASYKSATFLEIFFAIMQALDIKYEYGGTSLTYYTVTFKQYSDYTVPDNDDIFKTSYRELRQYDFVKSSLNKLIKLTDYFAVWDSSGFVDNEKTAPISPGENKKNKSFNLMNNFEIHFRESSSSTLRELTYHDYDDFLTQYVPLFEDAMTGVFIKHTINTDADFDLKALRCRLNIKLGNSDNAELSSDIDYLEEITVSASRGKLASILVWYDDGAAFEAITQSNPDLQADEVLHGYDFREAEYDIDSACNGKFYYVKNTAGYYSHYFFLMDATITAEEVKCPDASNHYVGDMEIFDEVQADVPTLLLDKTILNDDTILI